MDTHRRIQACRLSEAADGTAQYSCHNRELTAVTFDPRAKQTVKLTALRVFDALLYSALCTISWVAPKTSAALLFPVLSLELIAIYIFML